MVYWDLICPELLKELKYELPTVSFSLAVQWSASDPRPGKIFAAKEKQEPTCTTEDQK